MWDHALAAERATGVPAKFIVGQAALESGWGAREIRGAAGIPSHNLFGIKAGSQWQGRTVEVLTTEYENGVARKVVEKFRAYNNYSEAFRDWAQLMANNPRYAGVLAQARGAQDARGFAQGMQRAGYATDPDYGAKLARVINTASALRGAA
jgi:flagellar protein FlgJ